MVFCEDLRLIGGLRASATTDLGSQLRRQMRHLNLL